MALHWNWDEKIGTATLVQMHPSMEDKEYTLGLYQGNAYLIMLNEWEEDGQNMWSMHSFFIDKEHAKNALGLNKKKDPDSYNIYNTCYTKLTKIRLSKDYRYLKDLVTMLTQAFDNLTIEIYKEEQK